MLEHGANLNRQHRRTNRFIQSTNVLKTTQTSLDFFRPQWNQIPQSYHGIFISNDPALKSTRFIWINLCIPLHLLPLAKHNRLFGTKLPKRFSPSFRHCSEHAYMYWLKITNQFNFIQTSHGLSYQFLVQSLHLGQFSFHFLCNYVSDPFFWMMRWGKSQRFSFLTLILPSWTQYCHDLRPFTLVGKIFNGLRARQSYIPKLLVSNERLFCCPLYLLYYICKGHFKLRFHLRHAKHAMLESCPASPDRFPHRPICPAFCTYLCTLKKRSVRQRDQNNPYCFHQSQWICRYHSSLMFLLLYHEGTAGQVMKPEINSTPNEAITTCIRCVPRVHLVRIRQCILTWQPVIYRLQAPKKRIKLLRVEENICSLTSWRLWNKMDGATAHHNPFPAHQWWSVNGTNALTSKKRSPIVRDNKISKCVSKPKIPCQTMPANLLFEEITSVKESAICLCIAPLVQRQDWLHGWHKSTRTPQYLRHQRQMGIDLSHQPLSLGQLEVSAAGKTPLDQLKKRIQCY